MPADLSEVLAEIAASGVMRSNKHEVMITSPIGLLRTTARASASSTSRVLRLYGESASVPGLGVLTHDVRRYGYGPTEKKPVSPVFPDWSVSFRVDGSGYVFDFFRQWMRLILGFETSTVDGTGDWNDRIGSQGFYPNELAYKDDYAVPITVKTFDDLGKELVTVTLRDAYPCLVGEIGQDWSRTNDYAKLPVTFTYFDWFSHAPGARPEETSSSK